MRKSPEPVAGEHAPGPVRAVGGRRQPDQQQPRVRIAEAGHRAAPVGLVAVGGLLLARRSRRSSAAAAGSPRSRTIARADREASERRPSGAVSPSVFRPLSTG